MRCPLICGLLLTLALPAGLQAAPIDARPGETRITFRKPSTALRAAPEGMSAQVTTLPARTSVTVLEVKLPWLRVRAQTAGGPQEGWLKARETADAAATNPNQAPAVKVPIPARTRVTNREVSAAGRQFDRVTEERYRTQRQDLRSAYIQVDQMEQWTSATDPLDALAFIDDGSIGRRGSNYDRPSRLPPDPPYQRQAATRRRPSGPPRLPGPLNDLLKDKVKDVVGRGLKDLGLPDALAGALGGLGGALFERSHQIVHKNFTPEQEYYVGRAVAANAIARHGLDPDPMRQHYVRMVGEAIVRVSPRVPANFGGYHFAVLDTDEINGISGPGGFVLVSRGALRACQTEDQVAGLLAHELGHITRKHGEKVMRGSTRHRNAGNVFLSGLKGALGANSGSRFLGQVVDFFGKNVDMLVTTSTQNQYGIAYEYEADQEGTRLLGTVFYDWHALKTLLQVIPQHPPTATHPSPAQRVAALTSVLARFQPYQPREGIPEARLARHQAHVR